MVCNERNLRERRKIFVCELKRCSLGGSLYLQVEGVCLPVEKVLMRKKKLSAMREVYGKEEKLWSARGRCFKSANKRRKDFCFTANGRYFIVQGEN